MLRVFFLMCLISLSLSAEQELWKDLYYYNQKPENTWVTDCDEKKECRSNCMQRERFFLFIHAFRQPAMKNGSLVECTRICDSQIACSSEGKKL